jgi:hypothetical protein
MSCKGVCVKYKAIKPIGYYRYNYGQKTCRDCGMFMIQIGYGVKKESKKFEIQDKIFDR